MTLEKKYRKIPNLRDGDSIELNLFPIPIVYILQLIEFGKRVENLFGFWS
jgi:hypothetical protein